MLQQAAVDDRANPQFGGGKNGASAATIEGMKFLFFALSLALLGGQVFAQSAASPAPSASQMVEQLSKPATRSLTRSSRNLIVEEAPSATASAPEPKPSLSLLIQFDFDSNRIKPESRKVLADLATALQSAALSQSKFAIEGHTDAVGRADYNQRLSESRASAVRQLLMASGIDAERLRAVGKGSSELANADDPKAAENRRVRVVNLD
jgi:outer membrane protein OmpA-like peptidoglycan-associated protein